MLRFCFSFLSLAVLLSGCSSQVRTCPSVITLCENKPKVALLAIKDSSDWSVPWDMSRELTHTFRSIVEQNESLIWQNLPETDLSSGLAISDSDFLVAMELIEHKKVPYRQESLTLAFPAETDFCQSVLKMKVRFRIFDLRNFYPQLIADETICSDYLIPKDVKRIDYCKLRFGSPLFATTPLGLAHQKLVKRLALRIEKELSSCL